MNETEPNVWDKKKEESPSAWMAFEAYRDLGKPRTVAIACQVLQRPTSYIKLMEKWSSKYGWVARCRSFDAYFDKLNSETAIQEKKQVFLAKKQAQHSDRERIGRTLVNVSLRMIQMIQIEITERLRAPIPMKASDMAALLKASTTALELGNLMIDSAITIDAETGQEEESQQRLLINGNDPEALAREYRRIIDGTRN